MSVAENMMLDDSIPQRDRAAAGIWLLGCPIADEKPASPNFGRCYLEMPCHLHRKEKERGLLHICSYPIPSHVSSASRRRA
jgi:hypothetical protein